MYYHLTHRGRAYIPLAIHKGDQRRRYAIVDSDNLPKVAPYRWSLAIRRSTNSARMYAQARVSGRITLMHILLFGSGGNVVVDHQDHNGLHNYRTNIRICSRGQNITRSRQKGGTSPYKGVSWHKARGKWRCTISKDGKQEALGLFTDEVAAALAYDRRAIQLHGEFAQLNFPPERHNVPTTTA